MKTEAESINMTIKFQNEPPVLSDLCLFSSFSFAGVVEEYVYYYLQELQKANLQIVFISTSPLKESCINRLSQYAFLIIERENKCPDFGSWKTALSLLNWGKGLKSLLLANDSVFGPFFNIADIISSMKEKYDVWGMTESNEIEYHIQSYFISFNDVAVSGKIFSDFWKQVDLSATKDEVIYKYELGLSGLFKKNNFKVGAYANIDTLTQNIYSAQRPTNPTLVFWQVLIQQFKFPFLKRELLIKMNISKTYWPLNLYIHISGWRKIIEEASAYPVTYIDQFISNYHNKLKLRNESITLQKRKLLFLAHSAENNDTQQLLINFLRWLKEHTDIEAEIIICNKGMNDLQETFASFGIVTNFFELEAAAKRNLKERLIDEVAVVFSNSIANFPVQKFLSVLYTPQIICVYEEADVLKNYLSADNIRWLNKNIAHYITGTQAATNVFTTELGITQDKTTLIHKFTDACNIKPAEDELQEIKAGMAIPANAFVVGISAGKEIINLLPAIASDLCNSKNDIHIVCIAETNTEETTYEQLNISLQKANLTNKIHFIKKNKTTSSTLNVIDVFVTTSGEEIFPLINLDAVLAGKPVICFEDTETIKEYASFGIADTISYLDFKSLSAKVLSYYNNRYQINNESEIAAGIVNEHFTTAIQAPKILQLIKNFYDEKELVLKEDPTLTFLTHIYYENTWDEIRNKLKNFDNGKNHFLFSISEACLIKDQILDEIKKTFKKSYSLVTSNIGKDIGGKMALIDIYLLLNIKSAYIIFLHDKQSPHSITGESWKKGLFKIIDPNYQRSIITSFHNPAVGIVGDKDNIINEYNSSEDKFRNNSRLSKKLLSNFDVSIENYEFIGGSMYWIRSSVIENFFKKNNPVLLRENLEAGNVLDLHEEKLAHTWERMFSWIATNEGFAIKGI